MSEPEAVTRARTWIPLHRNNPYQAEAAKIMNRLLAAYDELEDRVDGLRHLAEIRAARPWEKSIREREAAAWDAGFKQGGPMHDENHDDPDAHTRNPYREGKTDD